MEAPGGIRTSQIVALSLVVGTFFTAQTVFMALAGGRPLSLEWDVLQELAYWIVWALLTPLILAAARRWPLDVKPVRRPVLAHAAIAAALAPAQAVVAFGLHLVLLVLAGTVPAGQAWIWMVRRSSSLVWGVFMCVFFYWVVVGVYNALNFRRLYAAERLSAAELAGRSATLEAELARAQL
ncbi:MAG: hypothetical protein ABI647_26885, partial [Gemmatimonadota bacterium]